MGGTVAERIVRAYSNCATTTVSLAHPTDLPAAVLLLTPMFVPLAAAISMDTVQLGIMMIINLWIGLYHPPVGATLFITGSIAQVKMGKVVIELIPFYFVAIGILLLFSFVPVVTLRI